MFKSLKDYKLTLGVKSARLAVLEDAVLLHETKVVKWNKDYVELNSGGWRTPSTKIAINTALTQLFPSNTVYLFQENFKWAIMLDGESAPIEFYDGIKLYLSPIDNSVHI